MGELRGHTSSVTHLALDDRLNQVHWGRGLPVGGVEELHPCSMDLTWNTLLQLASTLGIGHILA